MLVRLNIDEVALVLTNEQAQLLRDLLAMSQINTEFTKIFGSFFEEFPNTKNKIVTLPSSIPLPVYTNTPR